jgi:uncharacterized protein YndB with AHSA1/START domain
VNSPETNDAIVKDIVINAPAERVFEALTDPRQRVAWWGAAGKFQATEMESDCLGDAGDGDGREAVHVAGGVSGARAAVAAGVYMDG